MPILSPPPLPVERFEEFKHFALTLDPAGWVNATGIALSIQHMLGIVIVGLDAEEEALQKWAANFGTDHWREDSERAQRAAEQPLPYAFSFGFGLPLQGWDQAAWAVPPGKILELNSWLRWALSQFYAAHRQTPDPVPPASTQSAAIEPAQPAPTAKRKRPKLDPLITRGFEPPNFSGNRSKKKISALHEGESAEPPCSVANRRSRNCPPLGARAIEMPLS